MTSARRVIAKVKSAVKSSLSTSQFSRSIACRLCEISQLGRFSEKGCERTYVTYAHILSCNLIPIRRCGFPRSQPAYGACDSRNGLVDFCRRGTFTESEAETGTSEAIVPSHCPKDVARFGIGGRTGRAGTNGDSRQIHHQRLTVDAFKTDV